MCKVCEAKEKIAIIEDMIEERANEIAMLEILLETAVLEQRIAELEFAVEEARRCRC